MNEFIGWHKKRAEARYQLSNERALARFASQTPIFNRRRWWRIRQIENCCPNREAYAHQRIFVVVLDAYVYLVSYVENEAEIFLKTIIPSRKATKRYLGGKI